MSLVSPEIVVRAVADEAELFQALAIREIVFIEEQGVPQALERDADDDVAYHVLAFGGGHALATGRLVEDAQPPPGESGRWGRVGRMAVLKASRDRGIGRRVLGALEAEAARRGLVGLTLHAQVHAMPFYERHGYRAEGAIYLEAGIPHVDMKKRLA